MFTPPKVGVELDVRHWQETYEERNFVKEALILIALIFALFAGLIAWAMHSNDEWEKFVRENNCRKVLDVSHGEPARAGYSEGWTCADGVTYYR